MVLRSNVPRLTDIVEAILRIQELLESVPVEVLETDWQKKWMVERGVEIISEASRHLDADLKSRHSHIPWRKVAGIGNILRHDYGSVSAPVMWKLAQFDLSMLLDACRSELSRQVGEA